MDSIVNPNDLLIYLATFNSIEWIQVWTVFPKELDNGAAFNSIEWIPLEIEEFVKDPRRRTFNSIEWIRDAVNTITSLQREVELSIPLNGFP